jgi:hypothetical protein
MVGNERIKPGSIVILLNSLKEHSCLAGTKRIAGYPLVSTYSRYDPRLEQIYYSTIEISKPHCAFWTQPRKTFHQLFRLPRIGKSRRVKSWVFANTRQFPVTGFEKYLVFYRPIRGAIEVLRVLQDARDLNLIIGDEEP